MRKNKNSKRMKHYMGSRVDYRTGGRVSYQEAGMVKEREMFELANEKAM